MVWDDFKSGALSGVREVGEFWMMNRTDISLEFGDLDGAVGVDDDGRKLDDFLRSALVTIAIASCFEVENDVVVDLVTLLLLTWLLRTRNGKRGSRG